ncbi:uncharacterized protein [Ptychodera flava]|uniref:uncharacterized protein n=1 Tax=Ptychodera flava TaxID=63121 RepID=UPI00396A14AE
MSSRLVNNAVPTLHLQNRTGVLAENVVDEIGTKNGVIPGEVVRNEHAFRERTNIPWSSSSIQEKPVPQLHTQIYVDATEKYLPKEYKQVGTQTDFSLCTCNCNVARGIQNPYRLDIQQEHSYTKNPPISTTERPSTSRKRQSLQSETVTSNVSVSEHTNHKLTNVTDTNDEPSSDRNINTQSIIEIEPVEVALCHSHDHQNVPLMEIMTVGQQ